jgi:hypothetical protein
MLFVHSFRSFSVFKKRASHNGQDKINKENIHLPLQGFPIQGPYELLLVHSFRFYSGFGKRASHHHQNKVNEERILLTVESFFISRPPTRYHSLSTPLATSGALSPLGANARVAGQTTNGPDHQVRFQGGYAPQQEPEVRQQGAGC